MKLFLSCVLTLCILTSSTLSAAPTSPVGTLRQKVIIVSIDGGKASLLRKMNQPELARFAEQGFTSWSALTILPSITLPSHTSMLTGVPPSAHGIFWNNWRPQRGIVKVPTIFERAKNAGKTTAFFAGKEKFKHLERPSSLDTFRWGVGGAIEVARAGMDHFREKQPDLTFLHFRDVDQMGHKHGWGSERQKGAIRDVDQALGHIRATLQETGATAYTTVIITADHGGTLYGHGFPFLGNVRIPWITWGARVKPRDPQFKRVIHTYDTAATALWLLGVPVPADMKGQPVTEAY